MKAKQSGSLYEIIIVLSLLTINFAVFMPTLNGDFIWDDKYFISDNQLILGPNFLKHFLLSPYGGPSGFDENSLLLGRAINFYRPLTALSYWLDYKLWDLNPAGFHLTNIIIHSVSAVILYFIFRLLGWNSLLAFLPSLLFSLFPPHFENVSWISGRTDLISFFFASLSALFALFYLKKQKFFAILISSFFYLLSLLGKEVAVMLPFIFVAFICLHEKNIWKAGYKGLVYLPAFFIWFLLRRHALGPVNLETTGKTIGDFMSTLGFYVSRTIFPFNMSITVDSQYVFDNKFYFFTGGFFLLALLLASIQVYFNKKNWFPLLLWLSSYFLLILPSVIIIFFPSTVSFVAWRFLYYPSAVAIGGGLYFLRKLLKKDLIVSVLVVILACFYAGEIYPRAALFGNDEKGFWLGIKNSEREDILARYNIGFQYLSLDEKKALEIFQRILNDRHHHMHEACEIRIYEELAKYYTFKKEFDKARTYFDLLFQKRPIQSQHTYFNYAYFLALQGEREKGEKYIKEMLRLFPQNHLVLIHTVNFYLLLNDYKSAFEYIKKDYELFPNPKTKRFLSEIEKLVENKN